MREYNYCFIKYYRGFSKDDGCSARYLHALNITGTSLFIIAESYLKDWVIDELIENGTLKKTTYKNCYKLRKLNELKIDYDLSIADNTPDNMIPLVNGMIEYFDAKIPLGGIDTYDYNINKDGKAEVSINIEYLTRDRDYEYTYLRADAISDSGLYEDEDIVFSNYCEYEIYCISNEYTSNFNTYEILFDNEDEKYKIVLVDERYYTVTYKGKVEHIKGNKIDIGMIIADKMGDTEKYDSLRLIKELQDTCIPMFEEVVIC